MMIFCCIIYVSFCINNKLTKFNKLNKLSKYQMTTIKKLIENNNLHQDMRNKINAVLFHYYDTWSCYKAREFKMFHKHKCRHIPVEELYLYSRIGLMNAIRNYKGKSIFSVYAKIYIDGELYNGMTKLQPITSSLLKERRKKKLVNKQKSYTQTQVQLIGKNEWILNDISYSNSQNNNHENECLSKQILKDDYQELWNKIDQLDSVKRKIFYYKFNHLFERIRTNKQVGELMGCTEEHVRKIIQNNIHKLTC